jgi:hypothetical protein
MDSPLDVFVNPCGFSAAAAAATVAKLDAPSSLEMQDGAVFL